MTTFTKTMTFLAASLFGLGLIACSATVKDEATTYSETDDLVAPAGKVDSGYYSSLATELSGEFVSVLELDISTLDDAARQAFVSQHMADPNSLRQMAMDQVKLGKNQFNANLLHLNLAGGDFQVLEMGVNSDNTVFRARYSMSADSLVTYKELHDAGKTPSDFLNQSFHVQVPADPRNLFTRLGESCAEGHGVGHLNAVSFYYYFEPTLPSCDVVYASEATLTIKELPAAVNTYPEYDRLAEDGRVDIVIIFGAAESGAVHGGDWGVMMWRTFEVNTRLRGFEKVDSELVVGQRYERVRNGLLEVIDLISPYDLEILGDASFDFFGDMFLTHEIMFYNGHSFYGSLNMLNEAENYPDDTYQILFMNSCWSYEYYTTQVFDNKVTNDDPTGWALADVVNTTTPSYFAHYDETAGVLLSNLLAGVEGMGVDDQGRTFSWQNIIGRMNDVAQGKCPWDIDDPSDCRYFQPRVSKYEIFGASGVRTNRFEP